MTTKTKTVQPLVSPRLLTIRQVEVLVGFRRSWIYQRSAEGAFPKPVKIEGAARWRFVDIDRWLVERAA